jgi:putative CocE/NonD family hydrolase
VHRRLQAQSPFTDSRLVMGPWVHGGWSRSGGDRLGDVRFGSKTSDTYQAEIEFPFFMHHLKGAPDPGLPRAFVFETGTNAWRRLPAWPPKEAKPRSVYLDAGGRLGWTAPAAKGADAYVSDPRKPVPFWNGIDIGMPKEYMVADQRFVAGRPDVLVFDGGVLEQDLTVAGPIQVRLVASTTGTDADFVVKVIDVYPDEFKDPDAKPSGNPFEPRQSRLGGMQQLVRGEVMRGKFRHSLSKPEPFKPGVPAAVDYALNDVFHTFKKGHRLMVQVHSTWFPLMDLNPQKFMDIGKAVDKDFRAATIRIHRGGEQGSRLVLPVLESR